jgi:hypothetical protein
MAQLCREYCLKLIVKSSLPANLCSERYVGSKSRQLLCREWTRLWRVEPAHCKEPISGSVVDWPPNWCLRRLLGDSGRRHPRPSARRQFWPRPPCIWPSGRWQGERGPSYSRFPKRPTILLLLSSVFLSFGIIMLGFGLTLWYFDLPFHDVIWITFCRVFLKIHMTKYYIVVDYDKHTWQNSILLSDKKGTRKKCSLSRAKTKGIGKYVFSVSQPPSSSQTSICHGPSFLPRVMIMVVGKMVFSHCKESDARSLRGGWGEFGSLKPWPMASLHLHKVKLEHTTWMCNYGCSSVKPSSQNKFCNL